MAYSLRRRRVVSLGGPDLPSLQLSGAPHPELEGTVLSPLFLQKLTRDCFIEYFRC